MTHQQAAPARKGIQVVSAPPQARKTAPSAIAMPAQTGRSKIAMKNLSHLSNTGDRLNGLVQRRKGTKFGGKPSKRVKIQQKNFEVFILRLI